MWRLNSSMTGQWALGSSKSKTTCGVFRSNAPHMVVFKTFSHAINTQRRILRLSLARRITTTVACFTTLWSYIIGYTFFLFPLTSPSGRSFALRADSAVRRTVCLSCADSNIVLRRRFGAPLKVYRWLVPSLARQSDSDISLTSPVILQGVKSPTFCPRFSIQFHLRLSGSETVQHIGNLTHALGEQMIAINNNLDNSPIYAQLYG